MTQAPNILDVTEASFMADIVEKSQNVPVLVDFWADWCGPCKSLMPVLEALAQAQPERFVLARVNADTEQNLTSQFGVRSLPTVVLVQNGEITGHFMGAQSQSEVESFLDEHLGPAAEPEAEPAAAEDEPEVAPDNTELDILEASYRADPSPASQHALAMELARHQQFPRAFELLLDLLRQDISWNNNQARQDLQQLFSQCSDAALVAGYQRKLMTLLY